MAQGREPEQRVHRRQPGVAGADAVVALGLEVVEEPADEGGVEVLEPEGGGRLARFLRGEPQQQAEGVAVGGDRVWAGPALGHEPLGEECLDGRPDGAHLPASA